MFNDCVYKTLHVHICVFANIMYGKTQFKLWLFYSSAYRMRTNFQGT